MVPVRAWPRAWDRETSQYRGLFLYLVVFATFYASHATGEDGLAFVHSLFSLPLLSRNAHFPRLPVLRRPTLSCATLIAMVSGEETEHRGLGNFPQITQICPPESPSGCTLENRLEGNREGGGRKASWEEGRGALVQKILVLRC